jgi:hypothetical protein
VLRLVARYRALVEANDKLQLERLASLWVEIERNLTADMQDLAIQLNVAKVEGQAITEQLLWRMERYRSLRSDLKEQILRLAKGDATRLITADQTTLMTAGLKYSQDMLRIVGQGVLFNHLSVAALTTMAGMLGDGTPLYRLLSEAYPYALDGVIKGLLEGTARGLTPSAVAREVADRMGIGLTRMTLIARTETARAFRDSSIDQYRESGVCDGFTRVANKETACLACLALDGEHLDLEEDLEDHPAGNCFAIPSITGVPQVDYTTGLEWLEQQDEDRQREIMGDERYDLMKGGMDPRDMVTMAHDETWGDSPAIVPVSELQ